jgi:integrase
MSQLRSNLVNRYRNPLSTLNIFLIWCLRTFHVVSLHRKHFGGNNGGITYMGTVAKPLGALAIQRLKTPGYHAVGTVPGLYLAISDRGARSWILRTTIGAKRREIGLGAYPALPLASAHEEARRLRNLVAQGIDPIEDKRAKKSALIASQESSLTFERAALRYIDSQSAGWSNVKHAAQWHATLRDHAFPQIGHLHVRDITLAHVLSVLEPLWSMKTETASRLRGRIERVLAWATTRGYRHGINPATWRGQLDTVLPAPSKVTQEKHYPAVQIAHVSAFVQALQTMPGMGAKALAFSIFTAARSGEVRGARWQEIDLPHKRWTIPAARMKAGREHRVPLSEAAVKLLKSFPKHSATDVVFSSEKGGVLSDMTLSAVMRRMEFQDRDGRKAVPHGLRSTFRDWAAERTSYPAEVIEAALAHAKGDKVEAAYFRSDVFDKRRRLMDDWAAFLAQASIPANNVSAIRPRRSAAAK